MIDLTKEIKLDEKSRKLYRRLQTVLYALAVAGTLILSYSIVFPFAYFTFSFLNPNSTKNTVIDPRASDGSSADHGKFLSVAPTLFDTSLVGNYSKAKIDLVMDKKSGPLENGTVSVRKSFQAFLYPDGDPIGFKDGTLVRNNGNFFIISDGRLRQFTSLAVLQALGFSQQAFGEVSVDDLKYNIPGDLITDPKEYPDSSLFKVSEDYYILTGQKLKKFVSPSAYFSNYSPDQAISKDLGFLSSYPLSEELAGFSDGSIISYGISVYIVSDGKVLPVNNTVTFESMGYDWNDLISASGDEFSLYQKDKLFTIDSPHPDGTIFFTTENSEKYIVKGGQKQLFPTAPIAQSWIKKSPILVSKDSINISESCSFKKGLLSFRTYSCEIPAEKFKNLIGKDYEFQFSADNNVEIETLNVTFKKIANLENLKAAARDFINRVKGNYVPQS